MKDSYFNIVVKKILKFKGKILTTEKIKKIIQNILDDKYSDKKTYKMIYYLKNRGYLISIKKDLFFIKDSLTKISTDELAEKYYRTIMKDHCEKYLGKSRYIGGIKALELNLSNYEVPENINIINLSKQSKEVVMLDKNVLFKKYSSGKEDLFKKLKKFTTKIKVGKHTFNVANLELSILESLYNPDVLSERYIQELIKKILRKSKKTLNFDNITDIIRYGKHHSSINRLYHLSRSIDDEISSKIGEIIKRFSFMLEIK